MIPAELAEDVIPPTPLERHLERDRDRRRRLTGGNPFARYGG